MPKATSMGVLRVRLPTSRVVPDMGDTVAPGDHPAISASARFTELKPIAAASRDVAIG